MNKTFDWTRSFRQGLPVVLLAATLAACGGAEETRTDGTSTATPALDLELPDSLTGGAVGAVSSKAQIATRRRAAALDSACSFVGADSDDPFANGYEMTKFMVSAVAAWTCLADGLIEIAAQVPHDGEIRPTDNVLGSPGYRPQDPTHYSVSDSGDGQISVRMYYGFASDAGPQGGDAPGFYVSWVDDSAAGIRGRLVVDVSVLDPNSINPEDPVAMRMDFEFDETSKRTDMFMRFDASNPWADGLRIRVEKDLTAPFNGQVFTAQGLIAMTRQFLPVSGVAELPNLRMYTVSDGFGKGAALAEFVDAALGLPLTASNHLGNYLFTKLDRYYFRADQQSGQPWDWIEKEFVSTEFRGGRSTPASGGSLILPFDPSLDQVASFLQLGAGYFTGDQCAEVGDDCTELMNAVFDEGFGDQEQNQGSDPMDWRSDALAMPVYLETIYPNGTDWEGAFDPVFTP